METIPLVVSPNAKHLSVPTEMITGRDDGPVPMSFPAILRNPGVADRFAHLHRNDSDQLRGLATAASASKKKNRRDEKEGKRWVRRKENGAYAARPARSPV